MHVSALGFLVLSPSFPEVALEAPSIAIAAVRAGAVGVIDGEFVSNQQTLWGAFQKLKSAAPLGSIGIRLTSGKFDLSGAASHASEIKPVLILTASTESYDAKLLGSDISSAKQLGFTVTVEVINVAEAQLAQKCGADALIAKGHESGGRVGDTTSFVLMQQLARLTKLPVWVQGGVGLHSAAAFAAAGATGVVLDSQLYLCRDSQLPAEVKLRIERLDGTETTLLTSEKNTFRLLPTGKPSHPDNSSDKTSTPLREVVLNGLLNDEFLLVGQDGCFARTLAQLGGTVCGAIDAIRAAVSEQIDMASRSSVLAEGSPLAQSHGTKYPIIQGAMTRVSDTSDFAYAVAKEGGLPFLALSLMRGPEIEKLLSETQSQLGTLPWGVGLLGFVPQQLRQEQMAVVSKYKPPFALIAGGRPDQAKSMDDAGTKTYLHVPSPLLLKSFIEMDSRRFIFEGKECGGHVGPRSSMVLWESMIEVLLESLPAKEDPANFHVLFAGGIHDEFSAAMVATLAAPLTARGVRVGFLVGTAYLFTKEAVDSGAIVSKFQEEALKCDETVLLETGPGHSIRCINSPYKDSFDIKRKELQAQNKSRDDIREEMELMNLGRLRIASKGLNRGNANSLVEVPAEQQWQEGMYMIGQVAALHDQVTTIGDLHRDICNGGKQILLQNHVENATTSAIHEAGEPIAIVGMSCMFPEGNDVETYWQNILNKVDAITEVPETHFDWRNYYDPNPLARDKVLSKWGGFLQDTVFEPSRYGIPPSSLDSIDPMQVLILEAARTALEDAGYSERKFPKEKTSVILASAGHGPITALYSLRSMLGWKLQNFDESEKEALKADLPEWTEDSFAGYLGNVNAGRVANRFDLKGINFSIDAACASSLAALYVSISDLRAKTSDVVLLGAADTHNQPGDYLSFSKTHALSATGKCKTFDASADGIAISEGIAMLVLKRLSDAERDGDRIYAVIRGIGGSSDGRDLSLTAPRPAGQMLALERAYADAGVSPASVGLVEAHGTGTVAGDKAEVEALTKVYQKFGASPQSCAIGSVKTNIGHTKAAAGLASIVKTAKALHHKVLPPTINVENPSPACKFGEGPFYVNTESRPWVRPNSTEPLRAGVSAFGFGGTNFHAVLEEYQPACNVDETPTVAAWPAELFVWKASSTEALIKSVNQTELAAAKFFDSQLPETSAIQSDRRKLFALASKLQLKSNDDPNAKAILAIVANSLESLQKKIALAKEQLVKQPAASFSLPKGIHYGWRAEGARERVAFLFPGQGSQRVNMLKELMLYFPKLRTTFEEAERAANHHLKGQLSQFIYPNPDFAADATQRQSDALTQTQIAQPALGACDLAIHELLVSLGVKPDMVAGHSYGEYVALKAAGVISTNELMRLSVHRGRILSQCAANAPGAMAAVSCAPEKARELLNGLSDVYLANINTPTQCIVSGSITGIDSALAVCREHNIACKKIPVSAAFHTPLMRNAEEPLTAVLNGSTFGDFNIEVWSNTTASPYPSQPQNIARQLVEHALKPVLFAQQVDAMHSAGARVFVEVGPGNVLTGLTEATLQGKDFVAVSTENASNTCLEHFLSCLAALTVRGVPLDLKKLFWNRRTSKNDFVQQIEPKKNQLLYRVNSVGMQRITGKAVIAKAVSPMPQTAASKPAPAVAHKAVAPVAAAPKQISNQPLTKASSVNPQQITASVKPNPTLVGNNGPNGALASPMQNRPQSAQPSASSSQQRATDPSVERVMLQFQQSMLQMTNRFLETQQNVMLAYLQSGKGAQNQALLLSQSIQTPAESPLAAASIPLQTTPALPAVTKNVHSIEAAPAQPELEIALTPETVPAPQGLDTVALVDNLYEIVSDRTGYPRDMLDPTLDLEADLGIDSIKRVEILNNFRKLLPEAVQESLETGIEKLAGTKTLQGVIDWIHSLNDEQASVTVPPTKVASGDYAKVARGLVGTVKLPPAQPSSTKVAATLVVSNSNETADTIVKELSAAGIAATTLVLQKPVADLEAARAVLQASRTQLKSIGSLIFAVDPTSWTDNLSSVQSYFLLTKELEQELKSAAQTPNRAAIISVTKLGGNFEGTAAATHESALQQASVVGLTKTIFKEMPTLHVRALDFEVNATIGFVAKTVCTEILAAPSSDDPALVEVGFVSGDRVGLKIVEASFDKQASVVSPLTDSSVVLVTGGARGITAEICLDLSRRYKSNFIIVGRLPKPTDEESPLTAQFSTPKELKAAIIENRRTDGKPVAVRDIERAYQQLLREREVRKTLSQLQSNGSSVRYYSVDVSDPEAFGNLIDSVYETSPIDGVIHGAGVIEDALIQDKTLESFERVFRTKINGALTLSRKLDLSTLKFLFFFSSVVGRTGNAGQADYVAANEALNKLANRVSTETTARVSSLMWGPWQAGMAPPELEEVFARHGWSMIQPADGQVCFHEELVRDCSKQSEVLLVGKLATTSFAAETSEVTIDSNIPSGAVMKAAQVTALNPPTVSLLVTTKEHRYLQDHQFDGIPVMPMAVALEMMLETAKTLFPQRQVVEVSNMDIPSGIVFHSSQKELLVSVPSSGENSLSMTLSSAGAQRKLHFRCNIGFAETTPEVNGTYTTALSTKIPTTLDLAALPKSEGPLPQPNDVYGKWLFHGPIFQGMTSVLSLDALGISGEIIGRSPKECVTYADSSWILDPVLLDSALQLAGIWARHHRDVTVLPAGFKKLRILRPVGSEKCVARVFLTEALATELMCDLAIYDQSGRLSIVVEGLGGIASKAFNRFSSQATSVRELVQ